MGMQVNTNISALNSYRNLSNTQNDLAKSLEKLSSGLRINHAADDAAGLAISQGLQSQVGGLTVASRNAQDGISVIQTAEGSLSEVQTILQRVRDLAVQAGNDSNNTDSRAAITTEVTALTTELSRIAGGTNFNGTNLLDGSNNSLSFQVGANGGASNQIVVDLSGANVKTVAAALTAGGTGASSVVTAALVTGAQKFSITEASGSTSTVSVTLGAAGTYKSAQDVANALNSDSGFKSSLSATVDLTGALIVNAKSGGTVVGGGTAGTQASAGTGLAVATAGPSSTLDFTSAATSAAAITAIDTQITKISTARATLGAQQNRFESVTRNLAISTENLTAAKSRITDTDMASEMVKYTRSNILAQAGTAMLAQANQGNQGVLQLLR
ncbi:flagellin [Lacisediminihabitans profunda]|uniref:Flagellin n=1 Tax=Lacisediminihabitans profunda TaxID=2594790 RepID=A0A5C8ULG1_9MICO|nr:flagellin [Lacisediminihabitans profunda]TXN29219.1 flagellin [Lacisediminihabitans profunda]